MNAQTEMLQTMARMVNGAIEGNGTVALVDAAAELKAVLRFLNKMESELKARFIELADAEESPTVTFDGHDNHKVQVVSQERTTLHLDGLEAARTALAFGDVLPAVMSIKAGITKKQLTTLAELDAKGKKNQARNLVLSRIVRKPVSTVRIS